MTYTNYTYLKSKTYVYNMEPSKSADKFFVYLLNNFIFTLRAVTLNIRTPSYYQTLRLHLKMKRSRLRKRVEKSS